MYKRLYAYLECHNILYSIQFGFRQNCSTNHALISIAELVRSVFDNYEFGCGIFIDFKKAFRSRGFLKHFVIKTIGMRKRGFDRSTVIIKQSENLHFA